jgi:hypothetical protein
LWAAGCGLQVVGYNHWNSDERIRGKYPMDTDLKRRLVYGVLSLVLSSLAAWLASYLTNKLLGEPD